MPNHEACCCICKTKDSKPDESVKRFCACLYHPSCLKNFVHTSQKSSCPICNQPFRKCRIRKRRRPFWDFVFTMEICVTLVFGVLVILYCVFFFLITFTTYAMSRTECSNMVQLYILIPGEIYLALFCIFLVICLILVKNQYKFWSGHNYTLTMIQ